MGRQKKGRDNFNWTEDKNMDKVFHTTSGFIHGRISYNQPDQPNKMHFKQ